MTHQRTTATTWDQGQERKALTDAHDDRFSNTSSSFLHHRMEQLSTSLPTSASATATAAATASDYYYQPASLALLPSSSSSNNSTQTGVALVTNNQQQQQQTLLMATKSTKLGTGVDRDAMTTTANSGSSVESQILGNWDDPSTAVS